MSNEELALLVQQGDTGALPRLWEQTRRLIAQKAYAYYNRLDGNRRGVEVDDLMQQGYFALLDAVRHFDQEDGYKFNTYLYNTLKTAFSVAAGTRSQKRDMLDYASSLDAPVGEESDSRAIADLVPDRTAETAFDTLLVEDIARVILDESRRLTTPLQTRIIFECAYMGRTLKSLAEEIGKSRVTVENIYHRAIETLRRRPVIRAIRDEYFRECTAAQRESAINPYRTRGVEGFKESFTSIVEDVVLRMGNAPR
jgi:RNA polymerase sporulation-specific sigma factor